MTPRNGFAAQLCALLLGPLILAGAGGSRAEFRVEFDANYGEVAGTRTSPENLNLSAAVFFQPVDESKGPLAEAEFLSRASSLRYGFSRSEEAASALNPGTQTSDPGRLVSKNHSARLRYVFPESGWIVSLQGEKPDLPNVAGSGGFEPRDERGFRAALGVGRYLNASTSLELVGGYGEQEFGALAVIDCPLALVFSPGCERLEFELDSELETYSISGQFRRVGKIGESVFATTVRAGYVDSKSITTSSGPIIVGDTAVSTVFPDSEETRTSVSQDGWNLLLAGTWFPTSQVGIDLDYSLSSFGSTDAHTVGTGVGWFVSPRVELRGSYAVTFFDTDQADTRQWRATVRARF